MGAQVERGASTCRRKSGRLGSPTENAPERDCVFEHQVAVRIKGGTEAPCWRLSGGTKAQRVRERKGGGAKRQRRRRGIEGLPACVSRWPHPSSNLISQAPLRVVSKLGWSRDHYRSILPTGYPALSSQLREPASLRNDGRKV